MEEIQSLAERIKTNHDDLEAWQRLGQLVDDPQKKHDCRNQATRIWNERQGVTYPIPCKQCGTLMQVVRVGDSQPTTAVCPSCCQTMELAVVGKPAAGIARRDPTRTKESTEIAHLKSELTLVAIIVSNLIPIFGILFLGWTLGSVMIVYWFENIIVGLFALLKMAFAQGLYGGGMGRSSRVPSFRISIFSPRTSNALGKLIILPFFCVHFGLFCAVHGVFVVALFLPKDLASGEWLNLLAGLTVPILGMLVSHGIYFVQHYLRNGAYQRASLEVLMQEPYARIVPMHVGLIAAGFFIVTLGSPIWVVLFLVALKTVGEALAYRGSMKKRRSRARVT